MDSFVMTAVDGPIGWITLNDPDRLNPVTFERINAINAAAEEMSARDDVHVVIVTGAGRAFCAGADLSGDDTFLGRDAPPASGSFADAEGLWTLTAMRQPVIAMINGPAVGYGLELALQADIRIAAASARLGHPAVKLGTITDTAAATWLLPRLVGWGVAAEILYAGSLCSAEQALSMRLVNHVVPDAELRDFTVDLASTIAANSTWAVQTTKALMIQALQESARESVMRQFVKVNQGDPTYDPSPHLARFNKVSNSI
ncbi:enoyl-CoA hydratase/isomerase family protein [Rhodococcus qingshengii]|uniref:enoyl-CoA hydratase/isomerase family protein n=1 Tax=Rhodococcus qingshengii TaxID=334542 RepID=UPI0010A6302A|nr:enoyl-CoA hydratase/isomerase family protein [Rhodococcus qingshengii]THJ64719.1 enoyl-CoA hydratase/isomerase family protein [Rhodococcus qingshengii]